MSFMPAYSETQDTQQTPTAVFFLFVSRFLVFFCGSLAFLVLISLLLVLPAVVNATIKKKTFNFILAKSLKRKQFPWRKAFICVLLLTQKCQP